MWRISKTQDIEYSIEHRKGVDNEDADSISRYPMLGARSLVRIGADVALRELLLTFTSKEKLMNKWWIWAGRDTPTMARTVQTYKTSKDKILTRAPKESFINPVWQLAILMPRTEDATNVARQAINTTG